MSNKETLNEKSSRSVKCLEMVWGAAAIIACVAAPIAFGIAAATGVLEEPLRPAISQTATAYNTASNKIF